MALDLARSGTAWRAEPGWLNTATYGLPPDAAWDEMQEVLAAWRVGRHSWEPWNTSIDRSRAAFARLVQADRGVEVVTVPLSRLAESVAASRGATVVAFSAVQSATGELAALDDVLAA